MGVYKFYLGPHKSRKKEKYPYSNFLQHSLYHEYFTMSSTHMQQQVLLLDLLPSTRKCHKISDLLLFSFRTNQSSKAL